MGWYQVTKTIKGIPYRYRQRTWRENGRVQTESVYLGRADSVLRTASGAARSGNNISAGASATTAPVIEQQPPDATAPAAREITPKKNLRADTRKASRRVAGTIDVGKAMADHDRLVSIARDLYEKSNRASNDDYENAFFDYVHAKAQITAHQKKIFGDDAVGWAGRAADACHQDFEEALIAKRDGKTNKPPRPRKIEVPKALPTNGDFSGPFWDTPDTPERLRDQASLYYKKYLKVKERCDAYHALDVSSWQAARDDKEQLAKLGSQLSWYEVKCQSWFDRKIVFTKSRVILKQCE